MSDPMTQSAAAAGFCAALSVTADEPMIGRAPGGKSVWLILEVPAPWGAKALPESNLPDPVKRHLLELQEEISGATVQFIRQGNQLAGDAIQFFVGRSAGPDPALFHFELPAYESLLDIDIRGLAAGTAAYAENQDDQPLFLVCTNGKRDRCCAKWGLPVFAAGAAHAPGRCWQSSHFGGHRFAATVLTLPYGVVYGRVQPGEIGDLIDSHAAGNIYRLARLRGRTCYGGIVQAAEHYLREELDELGLENLELGNVSEDDEVTAATFARGEERYRVSVALQPATVVTRIGCAKDEPGATTEYRLVDISATA